MNAEVVVGLLEEMINLKVQQHVEAQMKPAANVAAVFYAKRQADEERLQQIRLELLSYLAG